MFICLNLTQTPGIGIILMDQMCHHCRVVVLEAKVLLLRGGEESRELSQAGEGEEAKQTHSETCSLASKLGHSITPFKFDVTFKPHDYSTHLMCQILCQIQSSLELTIVFLKFRTMKQTTHCADYMVSRQHSHHLHAWKFLTVCKIEYSIRGYVGTRQKT